MSDILSYNVEVMIMGSMSFQQSIRLLLKPTVLAAALAAVIGNRPRIVTALDNQPLALLTADQLLSP